jgi:hypothetical protein
VLDVEVYSWWRLRSGASDSQMSGLFTCGCGCCTRRQTCQWEGANIYYSPSLRTEPAPLDLACNNGPSRFLIMDSIVYQQRSLGQDYI